MLLPNHHEDAGEYRYGFNEMEKDASGTTVTQTVKKEELRIVGFKGVKAGDVTENNLRSEQRRTRKKKRGAY